MSNSAPERRRITAEEFRLLARIGMLEEDARAELIDGRLIVLPPLSGVHNRCVNRLGVLLNRRLLQANVCDQMVSTRSPVRLGSYNEPEPDVALLRTNGRRRFVAGAAEVLLIVEVADSTLDIDRFVKVPAYAAEGVPEVWIVALEEERLEVHCAPDGRRYRTRRVLKRGDTFESYGLPVFGSLEVNEVLGPPYGASAARGAASGWK